MAARQPISRLHRFFLWTLILVQGVVVLSFIVSIAPTVLDSRWAQDDAYVSYRYARNLVEGNGLVYNIGERVEGYTNYLWTVLSAVPLAAGTEDPLPAMQVFGFALWLGTFAILVAMGAALAERGFLTASLVVIPLAAHWSFGKWHVSGMETGLVSFLFLLLLGIVALQDLDSSVRPVLLGVAIVLTMLTRPDTVVFIVGVAAAGLCCEWRWLAKRQFWRHWLPSALGPIVLVYFPYTAWRLYFYGDLFPNTYYAKMAFDPSWERGLSYLQTYFEVYGFLPLVVLPVIAALTTRESSVRRFLSGAVFGSGAVLLYLWRLGGDFMEWRFLMPVTPVLYAAIGVGAFVVGFRLSELVFVGTGRFWKGRLIDAAVACSAVGLLFSAVSVGHLYQRTVAGRKLAPDTLIAGQESIASLQKYAGFDYAWREVGLACDLVLPPEVKIATTAAGMIPYFSRRTTLDLHGLTNREIGRRPLGPGEERGRLGHERTLEDYRVMRDLAVDVVIPAGRPLNRFPRTWGLSRPTDVGAAVVLLPGDRFFEIVILDHEPALSEDLRRQDDVIFGDEANLIPKETPVTFRHLLETQQVVDRLDVQLESSEIEHRFFEVFDPEAPFGHRFHEKVLAYLEPVAPLTNHNQGTEVRFYPVVWKKNESASRKDPTAIVRDEGRVVFHEAHWWISGVSADRDLTVVVRHDRSAFSQYWVYVNGKRVPTPLSFLRTRDSWGEVAVVIPRESLLDGANDFGLVRDRGRREAAGLYQIWFLQEMDP